MRAGNTYKDRYGKPASPASFAMERTASDVIAIGREPPIDKRAATVRRLERCPRRFADWRP